MGIPAARPLVVLLTCAALFAAGCGGGSGSSAVSTAPAGGNGAGTGAPKKATAPNAPAGSKVISCAEGRAETVQLRATEVDCRTARTTMARWERNQACALGRSSSRGSCALGGFRCQAVRSGRGAVVSCARPGGDISFVDRSGHFRRSGG